MTDRARRIQWLFAVNREVYRTYRAIPEAGDPCVRCGSAVHRGGVGFAVRDRGTAYRSLTHHVIHLRCIPDRAAFITAGLPAQKRRRA